MLRLFHGTVTGDLGAAPGNGFLHHRRGQHFPVQGDGDPLAHVAGRYVRKLLAAFIGKLHGYQRLVSVANHRLGVLQIRTGEYRFVIGILELQHRGLAQHVDGLFRILYARQFHDDAITALTLNHRFRQTQRIYTTFNDMRRPIQRVVIHFQLRRIHSLQHHVGTALQIQSLFNRTGQRPDVHNKPTHNGQRHDQELP